jgi:hypothetical protein
MSVTQGHRQAGNFIPGCQSMLGHECYYSCDENAIITSDNHSPHTSMREQGLVSRTRTRGTRETLALIVRYSKSGGNQDTDSST